MRGARALSAANRVSLGISGSVNSGLWGDIPDDGLTRWGWGQAWGMSFALATVVLDCPDADALAAFYGSLLDWPVTVREEGWVLMRDPRSGVGLAFQSERWYEPPVWPEEPGRPHKMLHLDLRVPDLAEAVRQAVAAGARQAAQQPQEDVRVLFDPAGHPFCVFRE